MNPLESLAKVQATMNRRDEVTELIESATYQLSGMQEHAAIHKALQLLAQEYLKMLKDVQGTPRQEWFDEPADVVAETIEQAVRQRTKH